MQLRDRIKELRRVPASHLRPNPKNWRTHPEAQQNALRGVLAEIGIANAVLARELPDGSLMLIDGHLRAETLGAETVPVLVLDVDEAEADKLLVTLDPLAAMAETDAEQLELLISEMKFSNESVRELVENTMNDAVLAAGLADWEEEKESQEGNPYTGKTSIPTYEPKGEKPPITELFEDNYCRKLLAEIEASKVPEHEKEFLRLAAYRHVAFNFENVAEYYSHSSGEVQRLFENSALVIVDVNRAIENGWARLKLDLDAIYDREQEEAGGNDAG